MENSKLFPNQFDVIDGDSYATMTNDDDDDELEDNYFTKYRNDINENRIQYYEFQQNPQEHLSQQLSQLSMINKNTDDDDDSIPKYLQDELDKLTCTINRKDLRHIAYILYEIGYYQYLYDLWSLYLQAGLGHLLKSIKHEQPPYWLYHETVIRQRLNDYRIKLDYYRKEYDSCNIDITIQHAVEKLVNEYGLIEIHMESDYMIALFYNQYHDHQVQVQFEKEASTKYQMDMGQRLFDTSFQLSTMNSELIYHRLQLLYDQPPRSYDKLEFQLLSSMDVYEKLLQRTKTQLMALRLLCLQTNIYQYKTKLKLQKNEIIVGQTMNETLFHLIDQRIELMHKQMKLKLDFHTNYNLRSQFHDRKCIGFINNLEIDRNIMKNYFNKQQLKLLHRGPSYVPPCQLRLKSLNQALDIEYQPLQQQLLVDLVEKYPNDKKLFDIIEQKTKEEFYKLFSLSDHILSTSLILERAYHEQQLISTIQQCLHTHQLILRRIADDTNRFYLIGKKRFHEQCQQYMKQHQDDYELLSSITNLEIIIHQHIHKINMKLNFLEHEHYITKDIYQQLCLQHNDIQLKNVEFLLDDTSNVKPIFSMESNITSKLSIYLDTLLRPTIEDILKDSFVDQDFDFIQRLHHQGSSKLQPTTILIRIKIQNFFNMFTYQSNINRIMYLLGKHCKNEPINNLSMIAIESLIELYLQHTLFIYQDHIYSFNRGMSNQTPFNTLLSSLCFYYWKMKKFNNNNNEQFHNEFLLQYNNELFFTWNQSKDKLHTFLDTLNEFYGDHIDMNIEYGQKLTIQNIYLENYHGQFYTTMNSTSIILPYVTGYPKVKYQKWFRSTLIHLIYLCTNYQDFTRQRISMEICCLISGYSHEFIENELENFNRYFNVNIYQIQTNELIYQQLRSHLLKFQPQKSHHSIIEFTYLYDYGPYHEFKKAFSHIWSTYTNSHPTLSLKQLKILFNVQHSFSLNNLLVQK